MTSVAVHHPSTKQAPWPLVTGLGVVLCALALLAYYPWRHAPRCRCSCVGRRTPAMLAVGLAGWARQVLHARDRGGPGADARRRFHRLGGDDLRHGVRGVPAGVHRPPATNGRVSPGQPDLGLALPASR